MIDATVIPISHVTAHPVPVAMSSAYDQLTEDDLRVDAASDPDAILQELADADLL